MLCNTLILDFVLHNKVVYENVFSTIPQCGTLCCTLLNAMYCSTHCYNMLQCGGIVLQCTAAWDIVLQYTAVWGIGLQRTADLSAASDVTVDTRRDWPEVCDVI